MNTANDEGMRSDRQVIEHHYLGCCWPNIGPGAPLFWGGALIVLGGIWLAGNLLGLEDWGRWLVPVLFITWGAGLLAEGASSR